MINGADNARAATHGYTNTTAPLQPHQPVRQLLQPITPDQF